MDWYTRARELSFTLFAREAAKLFAARGWEWRTQYSGPSSNNYNFVPNERDVRAQLDRMYAECLRALGDTEDAVVTVFAGRIQMVVLRRMPEHAFTSFDIV